MANNQTFLIGGLFALGGIVLLIYSSTFIVTPGLQAVVVQLGNPIRTVKEPGLNFKIPFFQNVIFFEKRVMDLTGDSDEVITQDRKRIEVEAFARYRISDPLMFYRTLRDQRNGATQLTAMLNSQLKNTIGSQSFDSLLSPDRIKAMEAIRKAMTIEASNLGVTMVDVRIRRADLPKQNQEAVFNRMKTEREQEAAQVRATGKQKAQTMRAEADKEVTVIKAKATQQSEILRGEGDAARNRILGEAYGRDPEFFAFYRSLKAYEAALAGNTTTMVLSPDSPFFRHFGRPPAAEGPQR